MYVKGQVKLEIRYSVSSYVSIICSRNFSVSSPKPPAMSWRVPPPYMIKDSSLFIALHTGRKPWRPVHGVRGLTTTRRSQAVHNGEDTSTAETEDISGADDDHLIQKTTLASKGRRRPPKTLPARCAHLLRLDSKSWGLRAAESGYENQLIGVSGNVKSIRKQKNTAFVHVTDGSCVQPIQVVLNAELAAP
jgi:hypothetical protein